jgi:hypothetical protein
LVTRNDSYCGPSTNRALSRDKRRSICRSACRLRLWLRLHLPSLAHIITCVQSPNSRARDIQKQTSLCVVQEVSPIYFHVSFIPIGEHRVDLFGRNCYSISRNVTLDGLLATPWNVGSRSYEAEGPCEKDFNGSGTAESIIQKRSRDGRDKHVAFDWFSPFA